jgi:signal transduction histidine kinase
VTFSAESFFDFFFFDLVFFLIREAFLYYLNHSLRVVATPKFFPKIFLQHVQKIFFRILADFEWFSAKLTKFTHFWSKNILWLFARRVFSIFFFDLALLIFREAFVYYLNASQMIVATQNFTQKFFYNMCKKIFSGFLPKLLKIYTPPPNLRARVELWRETLSKPKFLANL